MLFSSHIESHQHLDIKFSYCTVFKNKLFLNYLQIVLAYLVLNHVGSSKGRCETRNLYWIIYHIKSQQNFKMILRKYSCFNNSAYLKVISSILSCCQPLLLPNSNSCRSNLSQTAAFCSS